MITDEAVPTVRRKYQALSNIMDERVLRLWAASEALALGCEARGQTWFLVLRPRWLPDPTIIRAMPRRLRIEYDDAIYHVMARSYRPARSAPSPP